MTLPKKTFLIGWFLLIAVGWCGGAEASPALVKDKQCDTCHRFSESEAEKSAPDLFFAGNKFQKNWMESFLRQPEAIRLAGHTRDPGFLKGAPQYTGPHPALNPKEAQQMTDHLMSLKTLKELPPLELPALSKGKRVRVKILFERDYSCIACHQSYNLARQPRGGVSGPSLIDAGNRLRPEWVYQWLKNPKQFVTRGRMPLFKFDDETLRKMAQYIMSHKKDPENK
jgi:mono/diheme cytochrome c family protein